MNGKRAELHLHTKFSDDLSVIGVEEMIKKAEEYGLSAIAFTNLNSVQDFPEISRCADDTEVKIIYGAEFLLKSAEGNDDQKVTVLVKNQEGIKQLYKIISSMEKKETYDVITPAVLVENRENLLVGSNGSNGMFVCDYFEIYPACNKQEEQRNKDIYLQGKEMGIPVVAVSNAHYLTRDDAVCRDIIRVAKGLEKDEQKNLYLRTTEEMLEELSYLGEQVAEEVVINNTQILADLVENVYIVENLFRDCEVEKGNEQIETICLDKAHEIYGNPLPVIVEERLQTELELIKRDICATHYLIAHKITKYIADSGHYNGNRGTCGSMLVSFLLGITEINPLKPHYYCPECHYFEVSDLAKDGMDLPDKECPFCKTKLKTDGHHIPYESFTGGNRRRMPQFHINVSPDIQQSVMERMQTLLSPMKIGRAGTVGVYLRNEAETIVAGYENMIGMLFSEEEKERIILKIINVKRHEGVHPCELIVIPECMEFEEFTPMRKNRDNMQVTHLHYCDVNSMVPKVNIMSYTGLQFLETLAQKTGVSLEEIDVKDPEVLALFKKFDIVGIHEYDRDFMWDVLIRTKPGTFSELVKYRGLAHGTHVWTENGEYLIDKGVPLADLPTLRDDITNDLISIGVEREIAFKFSEMVRKGWLARKRNTVSPEELLDCEAISQLLGDWYLNFCKKIIYMFPKSHAVSYVYNDIRCAWFKKYYPKEFYKTYLECYFGDEDYLTEEEGIKYGAVLNECEERGITLC